MQENGINCPQVLLLRKHILVMSFIGHNQKPAPKLKVAKLSAADLIIAYEQCIEVGEFAIHFIILYLLESIRISSTSALLNVVS